MDDMLDNDLSGMQALQASEEKKTASMIPFHNTNTMSSRSSTVEAERTSNRLLEVFQNASSKWSTTCGAPQQAYEPDNQRVQISVHNYDKLKSTTSSMFSPFHPEQQSLWNSRYYQDMKDQTARAQQGGGHIPSTGSDFPASLDPEPLPRVFDHGPTVNNVYTFNGTVQQQPHLMTNARTREYLLEFLQQNPVDSMVTKEAPQPETSTSLASAFETAWISRFPSIPEPSPLPLAVPTTFCLPVVDESFETLQKLYLNSSSCNTVSNSGSSQELSKPSSSSNDYVTMESPLDEIYLNPFHCFLRKQIVVFEATYEDIGKIQGRNKGLALHQVGLGCRFCTPHRNTDRCRGATYHPTRLSTIYQTAQNLVKNHFFRNCPNMPQAVKEELRLRASRITKSNRGGGKQYWSNVLHISGIEEHEGGLFYKS